MNTFHRAAVVSAVVGLLFVALTVWLAVPLVERGVAAEAMIPVLLGSICKGFLALSCAAVMTYAGRLERRRQDLARVAPPAPAGTLCPANDDLPRRKRAA